MSVEPAIYDQSLTASRRQTIKKLIEDRAWEYGVTYVEVMSKCRHRGRKDHPGHSPGTKPIIQARFACMALIRDTITEYGRPLSYPRIGRIFCLDHSSVMNGVRRHREFYSRGYSVPQFSDRGVGTAQ